MAPPNKGKGRGIEFLRAHINHTGDDCLPWPLSGDDKGYGTLGFEGRQWKAHRLMCLLAHGPAPSPDHEASHSCGRGHMGCVNPKHLTWKTRSENQLDRRKHGTKNNAWWGKGGKLSPHEVRQIRDMRGQRTEVELADQFDVTPRTWG